MKLVKEHINFERGLDPKDAMSTGKYVNSFNSDDSAGIWITNNFEEITGINTKNPSAIKYASDVKEILFQWYNYNKRYIKHTKDFNNFFMYIG